MAKNKKNLKPVGHQAGRQRTIAILSVLVTITFSSLGALRLLQDAAALPGTPYSYSAAKCASSDAACYDSSAEAGVFRMYQAVFDRNPDGGGYSHWTPLIQSGTSLQSMAQSLLGSSEWQNKYSGISNATFVNNTYQFVLNRAPDSTGYNYWLGQLNARDQDPHHTAGKSRSQMESEIVASSEAANAQHAAFMSYYSPPVNNPPVNNPPVNNPPVNNPPTSQPKPPTTTKKGVPVAPAQSAPSPTGLQITDFAITDLEYRSAQLTWKTNKPATTKANYSTNKDDLSSEQKDDAPVTDHHLKLEGDGIRAGNHYYVRITSDDTGQPVTIDGEFDTKPISVIIKTTDQNNSPLPDAEVTIGDVVQTTDQNGETTFSLPEGDTKIFAKKGNLSQEVNAQIDIPTDEANPQRVTLTLGETSGATATKHKKGSSLWKVLLAIFLLIAAAAAGFYFFWWRRRAADTYASDPLEAENYSNLPPPDLPPVTTQPMDPGELPPPPTLQPVEDPNLPHHPTLPELVRGDAGQQSPPDFPADLPPVSPSGQPIPTHTSLPDLVDNPAPAPDAATQLPPTDDLPVAPPAPESQPLPPAPPQSEPVDPGQAEEASEDDGSLTIQHKN